ncbi:hypothetical protein JQ634_17740 [Bradyrhizobium sp. AUGA SZCCT0240]|jgi:hypothetical protein|uniref:hypothetical protein n=1 Tax=unclassified Bradyrhizobium TaxID=2631580 RepID=UPI001BABD7DA|nr:MULTISPECIES: hypothetical protein [unclassified Bradyrhizobium]MBR1188807.1 hypothetical protein [Bradyrhizobium sp. AUGA SZCCT0160]MBR1198607.1 hypothetical protein [Bradyrhizobium sp. AUGA SZCCT0158]MBR1230503.1 hypothetical protein [Bradyrhizobium sp. AUGA SZCCT0182]MBR1252052.1 hypothetical protein [Bradyrhizobium sp. AUGA SZCCT0169]MBR1255543.1 hypothetical protein [Bradyrhizobium sp. AUGA SZCCT0240]
MKPTIPLKLSAIAFTVLWSGWMLWVGGSYEPAIITILAISGSIAGFLWYRVMRWCFRLMRLLPDIGAGPSAAH